MVGRTSWMVLVVSLLTLLAGGCSRGTQLGKVKGKVTLQNKPLKNVYVQFVPDSGKGTNGQTSTAVTDENGRYTLKYVDNQVGAVVGFHRVVISDPNLDAGREREDVRESTGPRSVSRAPKIALVPARYQNASTTPLEKEVQSGQQTIDLDLDP